MTILWVAAANVLPGARWLRHVRDDGWVACFSPPTLGFYVRIFLFVGSCGGSRVVPCVSLRGLYRYVPVVAVLAGWEREGGIGS